MESSVMLFLAVSGFIASFIDSTVGGGGLISTPALLALGLPVNVALGTNKLASSMGSFVSVLSFWRAGKINVRAVSCLMPLSFIASACGAYVVYLLPEELMRVVITILLVAVAVYTYRRKDWGDQALGSKKGALILMTALTMAVLLGFYDGFFGPGTGSFLIFGFLFLGYEFVTAAGNAKALNFASGVGALLSFMLSDSVNYSYGLVMGAAMLAGAFFGSRMAIKHGAAYIKPLYLAVTTLLIGKQIVELVFK